jgi:hypothetical protein
VTSISSFSLEYDFFSFIQTAQNKMGFPPNQLYGLLRTRPARFQGEGGTSSEPSVAQIATVFASALALGALSLVWVPIAGSLGRGSTMIVSATKRKPPDRTG